MKTFAVVKFAKISVRQVKQKNVSKKQKVSTRTFKSVRIDKKNCMFEKKLSVIKAQNLLDHFLMTGSQEEFDANYVLKSF